MIIFLKIKEIPNMHQVCGVPDHILIMEMETKCYGTDPVGTIRSSTKEMIIYQ